MHLTNGTMQINFFKDHTKVPTKFNISEVKCSHRLFFLQIILCPLLGAVTYIDEARKNRTFRFE